MENAVKMKIQVSDENKYNSVNVRSADGDIIGIIKNGARVDVFGYSADNERTMVRGTQMGTRRKIKGSVLTRCLKKIE